MGGVVASSTLQMSELGFSHLCRFNILFDRSVRLPVAASDQDHMKILILNVLNALEGQLRHTSYAPELDYPVAGGIYADNIYSMITS
jgi:hypothetical protein